MSISTIAFYLISATILVSAFLAVTTRKIFRSAVWLLSSLTAIAAFYFWMDLQFLAAVQIVVYIGGIVVLIIFSIFLTAHTGSDLPPAMTKRKLLSAVLALAGFILISKVVLENNIATSGDSLDASVNVIGTKMLSTGADGFVLPFEAVSILLLVAMIGCIAIAMRKMPNDI